MKGIYALILATCTIIVAVTSAPGPMEPNEDGEYFEEELPQSGKLHIITITEEKIIGEYYTPAGGIHFQSEIKDNYRVLSITTIDGEPLIIEKQFGDSATLLTVTETDFLVVNSLDNNGNPKFDDYVVPVAYHEVVESFLKQNRVTKQVLRQLDNRNTNETRQIAVEQLVMREEIVMIMGAAQALGDLGIKGNEYPAALPFFVLAVRLQKYRNSLLDDTTPAQPEDETDEMDQPRSLQKRQSWLCTTGRLPYRGHGNDCFGMCGNGCNCWQWVCGDCCVHQGCYDHDGCCDRHGYWSSECLLVWGFSCSSYSC